MTTRRLAAILCADLAGYSRLMGADEEGTLAALKALRRERVDPAIAEHHGRLVKTTGDGLLAEFASVVDAVRCALQVQDGVRAGGGALLFRIGINLGDVIVEADGDLYGDGVNVAARLQELAEPGGICLSRAAHEHLRPPLDARFADAGEVGLKNIARPVGVLKLADAAPVRPNQDIRFCRAADGAQIAYAAIGEGRPLVKAANWMTHLEYEWQSPIWRHAIDWFGRRNRFVRYDQRGNGLSDWDVEDLSFEAFVRDLEAVVDGIGLERFDLLGISQGCAVSIAYAVRHPERVSRLVLYGGYARGWARRGNVAEIERRRALLTLIREGWGQDNPAFRQVFTSLFVPGATAEEMGWFNELERISTSPANAVRLQSTASEIDVMELLPQVRTPTLVLHARNEAIAPFEEGRRIAGGIRDARFVPLDSRNHLLLEREPAWQRFKEEVGAFLDGP